MHIIITLAIIVNILALIVLLVGLLYNLERPKVKAVYGYTIAGCMIPYIVLLTLVALLRLTKEHSLYSFLLLLCVLSPFVIGKFVKHETLKMYTAIQIACFIVSLVILLFNV